MRLLRTLRDDVRGHPSDYRIAMAMAVLAVFVLVTRIDVDEFDASHYRPDNAAVWVLNIVVCLMLIGRRRWPLRSFAMGALTFSALDATSHRDNVALFALIIAFYSLAAYLPPRRSIWGAAIVAVMVAFIVAAGPPATGSSLSNGLLLFVSAFALGRLVSRRRERTTQRGVAAAARARAELESAELAAAQEQLRVAHDLHDVVAHSLSVIAVQAGVGAYLVERDPNEARRAVDAIRATSARALVELDLMVATLRRDDVASDAVVARVEDVPDLVAHVRDTGLTVTLRIDEALPGVSPGASLAAYRIVQEALTNVVRHAGPASATVTVGRTADGNLRVVVDDDGRGAAALPTSAATTGRHVSGGNGLRGMRERVAMYGGSISCGPRPGGGFRVEAVLPVATGVAPDGAAPEPGAPASSEPDDHTSVVPALDTGHRALRWDAALAAVFLVLAAIQILAGPPAPVRPADIVPTYRASDLGHWLLAIAICAALALRRRFPASALLASTALLLVLTSRDYRAGALPAVPVIAAYSVAGYSTARRLVASSVAFYLAMALAMLSHPPDLSLSGAVWISTVFTGSAIAGVVARRERERLDREISAQESDAVAEARRVLLRHTEQRVAIANELRGVIASSLRRIANAAEAVDAAARREVLEQISEISRAALGDLRRVLARLRSADPTPRYAPLEHSRAGAEGAAHDAEGAAAAAAAAAAAEGTGRIGPAQPLTVGTLP